MTRIEEIEERYNDAMDILMPPIARDFRLLKLAKEDVPFLLAEIAVLKDKTEDWELKYEIIVGFYEQKWGLSMRQAEEIAALKNLYSELIMCVSKKYPGESRHDTAKRYIIDRETLPIGPAKDALDQLNKEDTL